MTNIHLIYILLQTNFSRIGNNEKRQFDEKTGVHWKVCIVETEILITDVLLKGFNYAKFYLSYSEGAFWECTLGEFCASTSQEGD